MPELPEVEIVRRRLADRLPGLLLCEVVVYDWTVSAQIEPELNEYLAGRTVTGLRRRGKYLLVDLSERPPVGEEVEASVDVGEAGTATAGGREDAPAAAEQAPGRAVHTGPSVAVIHLRMTGQLVLDGVPEARPPRFEWRLEPATTLGFRDVRRFGRLWALAAEAEGDFFAERRMGPEPFGPDFTVAYLRGALRERRAPLKSFLLDQRRLAGVGNIYADEALFRARLHPLRMAGSVGPREAQRLHAALLETLQAGIDHEGSSIESFIDPAGQRGSFQEILNVYQRTGEPCRVCGTPIERVVVGGRGTHFCPACQPRRGGMAAVAGPGRSR